MENLTRPSKVISIINSCETLIQLETSLKLIGIYVNLMKSKGVENTDDLLSDLLDAYNEKNYMMSTRDDWKDKYEEFK